MNWKRIKYKTEINKWAHSSISYEFNKKIEILNKTEILEKKLSYSEDPIDILKIEWIKL